MRGWVAVFLLASAVQAGPPNDLLLGNLRFTTQSFELNSGLRVVLEEDHSRPLVAVAMVVDSGSRQDPPGKEGLAHLVEHLSFEARHDGHTTLGGRQTMAGVGLHNASTSSDTTTFWSVGPSEALGEILALEGLRLASPLVGIDPASLEAQRGVIRNELRGRGETGVLTEVDNALRALLFPADHPYSRTRKGSEEVLSELTLGDARAFAAVHYRPERTTIAVVGDIDADGLVKLLKARLPRSVLLPPAGSQPVAPNPRPVLTNPPTSPPKAEIQRIRSPGLEHPMVLIGWTLPPGYDGQGFLQPAAVGMIDSLPIGGIDDGDLQKISASFERARLGTTLVAVVTLKVGSHPEATAGKVLDGLTKAFALSQEPAMSHNVLLQVFLRQTKLSAVVRLAGESEALENRAVWRAHGAHVTGDPNVLSKQIQGLLDFSFPALSEYASRWLTRERARTLFVDPWRASATDTDEEPPPSAGGENAFPTVDGDLGSGRSQAGGSPFRGAGVTPTSFTLANGLAVTLLPRKGSPLASASIAVRGGERTATPLGVHALAMMAKQSSFEHGAVSLVGGSVTSWSNRDTTLFSAVSGSGNLENVLGNLADIVRSMKVETKAVDRFLEKGLSAYTQALDVPARRSQEDLWGSVLEGTSYARLPGGFDFNELNAKTAQDWLARALTPRNAALAVAGDFDPAKAEALVRALFSDWQGGSGAPELQLPLKPQAAGAPLRIVRGDRPGWKQARIHFACAVEDHRPVDIAASEMLVEHLAAKLNDAARSTLGASYGFSGNIFLYRTLSALDVRGGVDARALKQVVAVIRNEVERLSSLHLAEPQVEALRWRMSAEMNVSYQQAARLAMDAARSMAVDVPVDRLVAPARFYSPVTADDMARAAAACRRRGVLSLVGDPEAVDQALAASGG